MAFGEVRLQSQGLIRVETRFFSAGRNRVEAVINPALNHGETGKSQGKVLDRA